MAIAWPKEYIKPLPALHDWWYEHTFKQPPFFKERLPVPDILDPLPLRFHYPSPKVIVRGLIQQKPKDYVVVNLGDRGFRVRVGDMLVIDKRGVRCLLEVKGLDHTSIHAIRTTFGWYKRNGEFNIDPEIKILRVARNSDCFALRPYDKV